MDASQPDIKKAYRKAALKLHPDVNEAADATAKFAQLSSAYGMSYIARRRSCWLHPDVEAHLRHDCLDGSSLCACRWQTDIC